MQLKLVLSALVACHLVVAKVHTVWVTDTVVVRDGKTTTLTQEESTPATAGAVEDEAQPADAATTATAIEIESEQAPAPTTAVATTPAGTVEDATTSAAAATPADKTSGTITVTTTSTTSLPSTTPATTTSTTPATTTSTTPAAATTAAAPTSAASSASIFSGQGTYFTPSMGACGWTSASTDYIVAISHGLFDSAGVANPNDNPFCGKKINASFEGKTVEVTVVDRCGDCDYYNLDFSPSAFQSIADPVLGRIDITWEWA